MVKSVNASITESPHQLPDCLCSCQRLSLFAIPKMKSSYGYSNSNCFAPPYQESIARRVNAASFFCKLPQNEKFWADRGLRHPVVDAEHESRAHLLGSAGGADESSVGSA